LDIDIKGIPAVAAFSSPEITKKAVREYKKQGYDVAGISSTDKIGILEKEYDLKIEFVPSNYSLKRGFISQSRKLLLLTDFELLGEFDLLEYQEKDKAIDISEIYSKIVPGDYVVHEDHGLGIFNKIVDQGERKYIEVLYARKDRLLIPLTQANKITKYVSSGRKKPKLTGLGGGHWNRIKGKVKNEAKKIAQELIRLYSMRTLSMAPRIFVDNEEKEQFKEFIDSFEYSDTEDQVVITDEIVQDLKSGRPMDRLLVGDVGFGKSEIAFRAAFVMANAGHQVAILAPTTVLVEQHLAVLRERVKEFPIKVAGLSRLTESKRKSEIIGDISKGNVDIVVGTHALLSDEIKFRSLGLLIVDEEQKFGVKQKEKIKSKRIDIHVLSMTATPIPRTLNMALSGIRDLSVLASAPPDRMPVKNTVERFDWEVVKTAVESEIGRNGQVYYLHNRVEDIEGIAQKIRELIPFAKIEVAHGQLSAKTLSTRMRNFVEGKIDVLVCTTIIENGLDLPNANTLIVDDASMYGLSQIYQIRGRVGRGNVQAYAFFFYDRLRGRSEERLDAVMESTALGSGYIISSRDLEIRGAGNILGKDQSGSIDSVGYALYTKLLNDEIRKIRSSGLTPKGTNA
jgi:transcription-repair coupling factor (superfamily II helicase)